MSQAGPRGLRHDLERLEVRENPSTLAYQIGFELPAAPSTPTDWDEWSSTGNQQFLTTKLAAVEGKQSLTSTGNKATSSRFWNESSYAGDASVSVAVRADTPTPLEVIVRGTDLNGTKPSYVAAVIRTGGVVELVEVIDGKRSSLGALKPKQYVGSEWLRVSLVPDGKSASLRVQRLDTAAFLNATGHWQSGEATALAATVTHDPKEARVGLGRQPGSGGMAYFDDFIVHEPTPPSVNESFDTTDAGKNPVAWLNWSNDGKERTAVASGRSTSPQHALQIGGDSRTAARSWYGEELPADVTASVQVYADNLIPAGVLVRGSNLDSATPSYYALTATRGLNVQLRKVVDGTETILGSLKSTSYVSERWIKLSIIADGASLSAFVYRSDTQQWLTKSGGWSSTRSASLEANDDDIACEGLVGVTRTKIASGRVLFDDFRAESLGAATLDATLSASQSGPTFAGDVTFVVEATPADRIERIEFVLDGKLRATGSSTPGVFEIDVDTLPGGDHELIANILDIDGRSISKSLAFSTAAKTAPNSPAEVRKYDHIRLAQLAYSSNPMGESEKQIFDEHLDLVVANESFLDEFESASAETPKAIYSNITNIYRGLLTDWLAYADAVGADREAAFYHVTESTTYKGSSPSSIPVDQFWNVTRGSEDQTRAAVNVGFAFGTESVTLGWTDRFREVNVDIETAAKGWSGNWEYVSAVNADGTPKTWSKLTLLTDGTSGFAKDGRITFDPPKDWKASRSSADGESLFRVRIVTSGGTGPVVTSLLGRDYTNANATGKNVGTIPAFDSAADKDGDGYLNDAEYAKRSSGFDARFVHESRLFYPYYGPMRFISNPSSSDYRDWFVDYHERRAAVFPTADGFFLDNNHGKLPIDGTPVKESVATYTTDLAAAVTALRQALPNLQFISNTVGSRSEGNEIAAVSTAALEEFSIRPNTVNVSGFRDQAELIAGRLASSPDAKVIIDSHPGTKSTTDERTRQSTLAYYYLLADPDRTYFMAFGGYSPSAAWKDVFIPSSTVDVGQPKGEWKEFANGKDPEKASLSYAVFSRQYENALVLFKPRSNDSNWNTGTTSDATATMHQLGGKYRVLNSDGTTGPVITSLSLRNGEGVVLMKV